MASNRLKNRFGRRYIRLKELCDYVVDLDLCPQPQFKALIEFFEAEGLLMPVRRIFFPPEISRRLYGNYKNMRLPGSVEPDGPRLDAADELLRKIDQWRDARFYGEREHVLDVLADAHLPFIQTEFSSAKFLPWKDQRVHLYDGDGGPIFLDHERAAPTFYHYWQVFWMAAILRSGVHVWFPLDDDTINKEIWRPNGFRSEVLNGRTYQKINLEAYRELQDLRKYSVQFEAVGYFESYRHNALQTFISDHHQYGQIPARPWQRYLRREREIACDALEHSGIGEDDIVAFISKQCEWWNNARSIGPMAVAEEYKRNIQSSLELLRTAFNIESQDIVQRVGHRTGHFKPTLEVIFPIWTEEQRDLTVSSLKRWADETLSSLPSPFPVSEEELHDFCDWLERKGLYQYYWHFRRILDLQKRDDPVHRAATAAEVVGFATLCEMIANEVLRDQGREPRGNVLSWKLKEIFNTEGPVDFCLLIDRYYKLTKTERQSLPRRLAQIARITAGGPHNPVLRAMLSLWVIRNEGAHLGLLHFDQTKIFDMIRILSLASLMLWKVLSWPPTSGLQNTP